MNKRVQKIPLVGTALILLALVWFLIHALTSDHVGKARAKVGDSVSTMLRNDNTAGCPGNGSLTGWAITWHTADMGSRWDYSPVSGALTITSRTKQGNVRYWYEAKFVGNDKKELVVDGEQLAKGKVPVVGTPCFVTN